MTAPKPPVTNLDEFPLLMSVADAGRALGLHERTVHRMIAEGEFPPARMIRRTWRVSRPLLEEWLRTPQDQAAS